MIKTKRRRIAAALVIIAAAAPHLAAAQSPVAVKTLGVESAGSTLSNANLNPVAEAQNGDQAEDVSSACRKQFEKAKEENSDLVSFGCVFRRLALTTPAMAMEYFGGFDVGNAIALTYGEESATLYTEVLSDNLWMAAGVGYARLGFSTQVAANTDTAAGGPTTVDQLFQGGGNAMLHLTLPLAVWINFVGDTDVNKKPVRSFDSFLTVGIGADIPELNAGVQATAGNARVGLQGLFSWRTVNEDFRFFVQGSTAYIVGFNNSFYENLIKDGAARPVAGLALIKGTVGVELAKRARVGVSLGTTTLDGVRQAPKLSIQLIDSK